MKDSFKTVLEQPREIPVAWEVDVCVVGAGAAGTAAAISAARSGQKVLLVEREGYLGGTLTTVSLGSICGLYAVTPASITPIVAGFADQVIAGLDRIHAVAAPVRWLETASLPYDLFAMKLVLDRLVREAGVELVLHASVTEVRMDGDRISHLFVETRQGRQAIAAKTFIDCSGDAELAAKAGAPFDFELSDLQQPTAMFRLGGVDPRAVGEMDRAALHRYLEAAVDAGMPLPRTAGGVFMERPGIAHLNITKVAIQGRAPNPFDSAEMTQAEWLGREQVRMYQEAFSRFVPGFEKCYVIDSGAVIGIRESRRLRGQYQLTGEDVRAARRFDDAIACCAWPMEEHSAGRGTRWVWLENGAYYQIPYRSLLPQGIGNLLVAGRCASATHEAQASLRVTAQCFAMGQAAGIAAAMATEAGTNPAAICVAGLQSNLQAAGAFIGD